MNKKKSWITPTIQNMNHNIQTGATPTPTFAECYSMTQAYATGTGATAAISAAVAAACGGATTGSVTVTVSLYLSCQSSAIGCFGTGISTGTGQTAPGPNAFIPNFCSPLGSMVGTTPIVFSSVACSSYLI